MKPADCACASRECLGVAPVICWQRCVGQFRLDLAAEKDELRDRRNGEAGEVCPVVKLQSAACWELNDRSLRGTDEGVLELKEGKRLVAQTFEVAGRSGLDDVQVRGMLDRRRLEIDQPQLDRLVPAD